MTGTYSTTTQILLTVEALPHKLQEGDSSSAEANHSTDGARLTKESPANIRTGAHAGRESGCESSSPAGRASSLREGVTLTGASLLWKTPASPSRICLRGKRRPLLTGRRDYPQSMSVAEITTMRKFGGLACSESQAVIRAGSMVSEALQDRRNYRRQRFRALCGCME